MAEDISNKSLVVLLVLAIAVSLVGTMVSIGRISKMGFPVITARGTTGKVYLNISQDITINVTQTDVQFGIGSVVPPESYCLLNTTMDSNPSCWSNSTFDPAPFVVKNDGNVNVNFTVTSGKNAAEFIGGTSPAYGFTTADKDTGAASTHVSTITAFDKTAQFAVGGLQPGDLVDEVYVHVYITVPDNAIGNKDDTITFTSSASS